MEGDTLGGFLFFLLQDDDEELLYGGLDEELASFNAVKDETKGDGATEGEDASLDLEIYSTAKNDGAKGKPADKSTDVII